MNNSSYNTDILSAVVYNLVDRVLNSSEGMRQFSKEKNINTASVTKLVLSDITNTRKSLTIKDCCDILSNKYDDNFNPSRCVVYNTGKTRYKADANYHKHCGNKDIVCGICTTTTEGQKVLDQIQSGTFNADEYRKRKTKLRITFAKTKLKNKKVDHFYLPSRGTRKCELLSKKLFIKADFICEHSIYYCSELNLYVTRKYVGEHYKNITLGELNEEGSIKKLSYETLLSLKGLDVTVDCETLSKKCLKVLEMSAIICK
jgi:hypothetical protein